MSTNKYVEYYSNQSKQLYGGSMRVYRGSALQSGHGLGSVFKSLQKGMSWILPILKTHAVPALKYGADQVGKQLIKTAVNVANDSLEGKNFTQSVSDRAVEGLHELKSAFVDKLKGAGIKRKSLEFEFEKRKKPRKRSDIFDYYQN